jgi:GAF domain-containing protein
VPEIHLDARWAPFIGLADANSVTACWSFPILSDSAVLGTIAVYHEQPCAPRLDEAEAMRYLATLASAAIGRSKLKELSTRS